MLLFIRFPEMIYLPRDSFNTSYVTLYLQNKTHLEHQSFSFNTISYYSLSKKLEAQKKKLQPFQYISCYSLSSMGYPLVLVALWVSIHLMLLFIDQQQDDSIPYCAFQYISCYSLSEMSDGTQGNGLVSIHLMLLFISIRLVSSISAQSVSIHLMLLFI